MFGYIGNLDSTLGLLTQLRRQMDRTFEDFEHGGAWRQYESVEFPPVNLHDTGSGLVVTAEVPGIKPEDLKVTLNREVLTIAGEIRADVPEGYSVHRRERQPVRFARSFSLPAPVDPDRVEASVVQGVLTVKVEKADEIKPRSIAVKAR
jgi:HSP20 family protein